MGAHKKNSEIRREQIAQATLVLLVSHGLKGVTIAGVARLVGLVPSALYRHFKNKDELIDATLDLIRDRLLGDDEKSSGKKPAGPVELLWALLQRQIHLVKDFHAIPRIFFSEEFYIGHPKRKTKMRAITKSFLDRIAHVVRDGQRQGKIHKDVAPETVSMMLLGIFQSCAMLWHMHDRKFDMITQSRKAWEILSAAIQVKQ